MNEQTTPDNVEGVWNSTAAASETFLGHGFSSEYIKSLKPLFSHKHKAWYISSEPFIEPLRIPRL